MSSFKIGDWVYFNRGCSGEKVFKVTRFADLCGWPGDDDTEGYNPKFCHLLTPLEPKERIERRTRCAVIEHNHVFDVGEIVEWDDSPNDMVPFVKNEINGSGAIQRYMLARLPDCAQRAPGVKVQEENLPDCVVKSEDRKKFMEMCDSWDKYVKPNLESSINQWYGTGTGELPQMKNPPTWLTIVNTKTGEVEHPAPNPDDPNTDADKPQKTDTDTEKSNDSNDETPTVKEPLTCPHPEWEGVWLYCGVAHRVEWDGTGFMAHEINTPDMDVFCLCPDTEWYSDGPTPRWTQLEPAPTSSTAGPKLPRPSKHGGVTVPWDPYGEG